MTGLGRFRGTDGDADRLAGIGPHLEGLVGEDTGEQLLAIEGGGLGDVVQLGHQLVDIRLDGLAGLGGLPVLGRLDGLGLDGVDDIDGLFQGTISGLHHGDTVVGVPDGLTKTQGLRLQGVGNGHARGVVRGPVDAQAGREFLQGRRQAAVILDKVFMSVQGAHIGIDT